MYFDTFNSKLIKSHLAKDWTLHEVNDATDEITYDYAVGDTESQLTITILPSTNDSYYHVKTYQEIWFYEDAARDELADYHEIEKTVSFKKIKKQYVDSPFKETTIEDIVGTCLSRARSLLINPLDATIDAIRHYGESCDAKELKESYRRTVSRGDSLVDNSLFVDFD